MRLTWVERVLRRVRFVVVQRQRIRWALDKLGRRRYGRRGRPIERSPQSSPERTEC